MTFAPRKGRTHLAAVSLAGLSLAALSLAALALTAAPARAQAPLKIGVLSDFSSVYSDIGGQGNLEATKLAVEEFGGTMFGKPIEVISADPQNKADIAASIARKWYENEGVDMIIDMPTSATALAGMEMSKQFEKLMIVTDAASSDITGKSCSPYTVHWTYDTYGNAHTVGSAIVKNGGTSWFFITADYLFGHSIERDTGDVVRAAGGTVVGSARHPLNNQDFSSFLLQAQASKAKIIGMANGGGDTINTIKQAAEFGITKGGQKLAALLLFLTDVKSIGLDIAQGLNFTETFYWDMNDQTRAFSERFAKRMKNGAPPTMVQAGVYAGLLHYFKALEALGENPHDGVKIVEKMKSIPTEDALFGKGEIQPNGRTIHTAYLFEVKKPSESKAPWDLYKLVGSVPGDQAFTPLDKSACALLKK